MAQTRTSDRRAKGPAVGGGLEELTQEVTRLLTLEAAALRERWAALFDANPSRSLGRVLLIRALAYRLQERSFAGLKPSTQRVLDRVAGGSKVAHKGFPKRRASVGTVLIREWRGVSHRVTVLENEVVYRDRRYKSLSEVARAITGSRWSGPLFFGLTGRAKEAING